MRDLTKGREMRNMSFALTTQQVREKTKTVTRRLGWENLKAGELIRAVEKCQGLKKGEKIRPICVVRVKMVNREPLQWLNQHECVKEGFPFLTPEQFVEMFCEANGCRRNVKVTRIEFEYVTEES
jgi:hypothetical protein